MNLLYGKRLFLSVFFLGLHLIPFTTKAQENWQLLEKGLAYKKKENYHFFRIDLKHFDLKPIFAPHFQSKPIRSLTLDQKALLGINANFFDVTQKPLGLVQRDGKVFNPLKEISWWGVFYASKNDVGITLSSLFKNISHPLNAVEGGPRLLINGQIPKLKSEVSAKTALGINKQKEVFVVINQAGVDIRDLAQVFQTPESKGGLGCIDALNLDGGSSTQAYAKIGKFELNAPSFVTVPMGLGLYRK